METKHKAIKVRHCDPGEECEASSDTAWPAKCEHLPAIYSIANGSGYVVACRKHAQEVVDQHIEDGDLFSYDDQPSACERNSGDY